MSAPDLAAARENLRASVVAAMPVKITAEQSSALLDALDAAERRVGDLERYKDRVHDAIVHGVLTMHHCAPECDPQAETCARVEAWKREREREDLDARAERACTSGPGTPKPLTLKGTLRDILKWPPHTPNKTAMDGPPAPPAPTPEERAAKLVYAISVNGLGRAWVHISGWELEVDENRVSEASRSLRAAISREIREAVEAARQQNVLDTLGHLEQRDRWTPTTERDPARPWARLEEQRTPDGLHSIISRVTRDSLWDRIAELGRERDTLKARVAELESRDPAEALSLLGRPFDEWRRLRDFLLLHSGDQDANLLDVATRLATVAKVKERSRERERLIREVCSAWLDAAGAVGQPGGIACGVQQCVAALSQLSTYEREHGRA